MGWIGSTLLVIGMLMVGQRKRAGFLVGLVGESFWVLQANATEQWDLLVICLIFVGVYAHNWWAWRPRKLRVLQ